jgi:hypothetical protein
LRGERLSLGTRGVSNVVERSPIRIDWQRGHLVVVRLLREGELFTW